MTTHIHTPSRSCYQHGCPRPECKQADYQYMSRLRLDHHRGQKRRCDATQTRHHIERLLAAGWTQAQIARAAGLAHRTVGAVVANAANISTRTALAILSVPIGPAPNDTRDVDATGTVRRLRALVAVGYPIAHLADRFGIYPTALGNIARGQLAHVRATTADLVALEYRELCHTPGPSQRAREEAAKKGWRDPLWWEDMGGIDDPAFDPDQADSELNFHERAQLRREEIIHLAWCGDTPEQILDRLNNEVSISTVRQIVQEWRTGQKRDRKQVLVRNPESVKEAA